jgi:hypothetical protein
MGNGAVGARVAVVADVGNDVDDDTVGAGIEEVGFGLVSLFTVDALGVLIGCIAGL